MDKTIHGFAQMIDQQFFHALSKSLLKEGFPYISHDDLDILTYIKDHHPHMSEVADYMSLSKSTMSAHMNSLVKKGFVIRRNDEMDHRVIYLSLTDKGSRIVESYCRFYRRFRGYFSSFDLLNKIQEDVVYSLAAMEEHLCKE